MKEEKLKHKEPPSWTRYVRVWPVSLVARPDRSLPIAARHGTADAPVLVAVTLPEIVEGGEQDDVTRVVGESLADRLEGHLLVVKARNSKTIGRTLGGPASLRDNYPLVRGKLRPHALDSPHEPGPSLVSRDGAVKVGMGVDGAVVGLIAQLRVGLGSNEGVNSDNWPLVPSTAEDGTGLLDGGNDLLRAGLAIVDELVANAD